MSNPEDDFKLLAIKPLKGCQKKYANNLIPGTLYPFYQDYEFNPKKGPITQIRQLDTGHEIFNAFVPEQRELKINVSAIVGKNGSGKSTLVELFYLCAYLVANAHGLLPINPVSKAGINETRELGEIKEGLKLEVYFQSKSTYHCIVMDADYTPGDREKSDIVFYNVFGETLIPMANFFYTIAINYSIHGLNERIVGKWLSRLFHKRDAYQTPMVLNPFRDEGLVNPNAEILFAQSRLLANIRFSADQAEEILPGRSVKEIKFVIDRQKLSRTAEHHNDLVFEKLEQVSKMSKQAIFRMIYLKMLGEEISNEELFNNEWAELTVNYVLSKIIRIAKNYPEYKKFYKEEQKESLPELTGLPAFLSALEKDRSHITLKLRQALNFFRNDPLKLGEQGISFNDDIITIEGSLFARRLRENREKYPSLDPMELMPNAPFSAKIVLNDGQFFHHLSSGEQQLVHSVQAVLYHLLNLDSVFHYNGEAVRLTYSTVNIIFDEIELYFHPEFQRMFVSEILKRLSALDVPNISRVNLLFLTHSPFILSDIPVTNVLHLENGMIRERKGLTFAANIHQMLSDSFFMKSTTGDFAKSQIEQIIRFYESVLAALSKEQDVQKFSIAPIQSSGPELSELARQYQVQKKKYRFIIDQIGEPVITGVLENHITFIEDWLTGQSQDWLTIQKQRLERELAAINKKITNRS
ncbi:hypothetical protein EA772_10680 [Pedobacter sp. G11]|uniref:AAA family ATPase n=1 Tax=Pedobacter sp. G11 TaxID=2482728 RepID=UPI000F600D25|nr:AAA family ATPase [Pedobacter sp. G11]AZI25781.1 hypothetical protein EA772_10680 [Pedobacter sp. G11]